MLICVYVLVGVCLPITLHNLDSRLHHPGVSRSLLCLRCPISSSVWFSGALGVGGREIIPQFSHSSLSLFSLFTLRLSPVFFRSLSFFTFFFRPWLGTVGVSYISDTFNHSSVEAKIITLKSRTATNVVFHYWLMCWDFPRSIVVYLRSVKCHEIDVFFDSLFCLANVNDFTKRTQEKIKLTTHWLTKDLMN